MHKFLKRLSMPQESGSSSFQHLNKVGSPALPEQKPLRGFVLSSFPGAPPPHPPLSSCPTVPNMLDDVFFFGFSFSFSGSSSTSHKYINCIVSKKFFQSGLRLTEKVVKVLFSPLVYCVISFARLWHCHSLTAGGVARAEEGALWAGALPWVSFEGVKTFCQIIYSCCQCICVVSSKLRHSFSRLFLLPAQLVANGIAVVQELWSFFIPYSLRVQAGQEDSFYNTQIKQR